MPTAEHRCRSTMISFGTSFMTFVRHGYRVRLGAIERVMHFTLHVLRVPTLDADGVATLRHMDGVVQPNRVALLFGDVGGVGLHLLTGHHPFVVVQLVSHKRSSTIRISTKPTRNSGKRLPKNLISSSFFKLIIIHLSFITPSGAYCCTWPSLRSNA